MHVEFVRSGGVAGLILRAEVDAAELTAEEAAGIDDLRRVRDHPGTAARDLYSYRFVVTDGSSHQVHVFSEAADVPETVRPLLDRMTSAATRSR